MNKNATQENKVVFFIKLKYTSLHYFYYGSVPFYCTISS